MIRTLWFLAKVALVIAIAVWLAENPGTITVSWLGYVVETSIGLLILALVVIAVVAALAYRLWRAVIATPRRIRRGRTARRRERGYRALTRGWVAVAAGDGASAKRQAQEAEKLLGEPALTELLSAQAAQLGGDDQAAERYFRSMANRPETAFLGVRGLLTMAMRKGDRAQALELARRARDLQPRTPWVLSTLFDLEARAAHWRQAEEVLTDARRYGGIPEDTARKHQAAIELERSYEAELDNRPDAALSHAGTAHELVPGFAPAAARLARLLARVGKQRQAVKAVERAWKIEPHPDLAEAWRDIEPDADPLQQVKRFERLLALNPDQYEGHVALSEASMAARLWGEARNHLSKALAIRPSARVYRLLAELEQQEHGDTASARDWLAKAATAPGDGHWGCAACSAHQPSWRSLCPNCGSFDTIGWQQTTGGAVVPVQTIEAVPLPATPREPKQSAA